MSDSVCPGCGSDRFRSLFRATDRLYRTTANSFFVVECAGCGLIRLHPFPSADELHRYYPDLYWFTPDTNAAGRLEELYRRFVLRDHVSFADSVFSGRRPGPILDIGCGGALFGRLLRDRGYRCFGLDSSQQAAKAGWSVNGVPVVVGDFAAAPFQPGSLAGITMFHVLEHLYNPGEAIGSVRDLLDSHGSVVIQVPNAASWQFLLFRSAWNGIDVPRHLVDFRAEDLHAFLERCGFDVLRSKYFSLRDNPAGLATTLAPGLDPMARRVRNSDESPAGRLFRDLVYLGLVVASVPFALLEAAFSAGSTVMVEARKRRS